MIFAPAMNQPGAGLPWLRPCQPVLKPVEIVAVHRVPRLDFDRDEIGSGFDQHVHFMAGAVAPEIQIGRQAEIKPGLGRIVVDAGLHAKLGMAVLSPALANGQFD
jgi:hypothetical protein